METAFLHFQDLTLSHSYDHNNYKSSPRQVNSFIYPDMTWNKYNTKVYNGFNELTLNFSVMLQSQRSSIYRNPANVSKMICCLAISYYFRANVSMASKRKGGCNQCHEIGNMALPLTFHLKNILKYMFWYKVGSLNKGNALP